MDDNLDDLMGGVDTTKVGDITVHNCKDAWDAVPFKSDRIPFVWQPGVKTVYLGQPGSYHHNIHDVIKSRGEERGDFEVGAILNSGPRMYTTTGEMPPELYSALKNFKSSDNDALDDNALTDFLG